MKSRYELSKNCDIHGKSVEIFGPYNFWTPMKSIISDIWTETLGTSFFRKLKLGAMGHLSPPMATSMLDDYKSDHDVPLRKSGKVTMQIKWLRVLAN